MVIKKSEIEAIFDGHLIKRKVLCKKGTHHYCKYKDKNCVYYYCSNRCSSRDREFDCPHRNDK